MKQAFKTFTLWLCSLALVLPTALLSPAFAAATVTTTTSVAANVNPVTVGSPSVLTASVVGTAPTGTVTFKKGTTTLGTGTLSGTGNTRTATYSATFTAVAANSVTAVYAGDTVNKTSTSAALTVNSAKANATASVAASANPSTFGTSVTFTATVVGYTPTGVVTFKDGTTTLGTGTLAGTGNTKTATLATAALGAANHSITAVYAGDTLNNTVTSSALSQVVNPKATTTTLASSLNPSTAGAAVTLTATVTGTTPTGTVTFKDGTTTLGTGTVASGKATLVTSALSVATHSITAVYGGNATNATSTSSAVSQVVSNKTTATASVTSSLNPSTVGGSVTFTATVVGYNPSGTVTFKDGTTTMGTGTLSGSGNTRTATYTKANLAVATHSITAVYPGDTLNNAVTSSALSQVVNKKATATTLNTSAGSAALGTAVTFTATVAGNAPTGTVTFKDGTTVLGTGTVTNGVASYVTSILAVGTHYVTAVYGGDAGNTTSTSSAMVQTMTAALIGDPMTWQYGYDAMGRPTISADPYGKTAYTYYDSLGRPIQTQQTVGAAQSIISLEYNGADGLTKVTDPRNLQTTYSPTGLGTVTAQTSPDTGSASATYDDNRNLTSRTDARGKLTTYTYDGLNRLTTVHYPTGTDTTLEYDGGATPTPAATGELTKVTDESGSTSYTYDSAGRRSTKTQITNGKTFTVIYTWGDTGSSLDKLIAITYPSGNRVNYSYDATGTVSGITVNKVNANGVGYAGSASALLSNITLNAANQVTGWTWASGKTQVQAYDQYGQPNSYMLGDPTGTGASAGSQRSIGYDGAGNIIGYNHFNNEVLQVNLDQFFAYDDLNRLVSANLGSSSIQYNYDASGNRTSKVISGTAYTNNVSPTSNKLTQTQDVGGTATIQYDLAGNVTNDGVNTYTYSDRGRLFSVTTAGGVVNYRYNGFEQRAYKTGPTSLIPTGAAYYVYDETGILLGEYDANQTPIYETVYLNSSPVGVLKQTGTAQSANIATSIYNVYSDHLATPRVITRQSDEAIVWRWDAAEPFGATAPDQNPKNLGVFTFNQRLPGQVFDSETGLFQNWHREYNARLGRYIQSDPIGLAGGINTYAYVEGNPLSFIDPLGLQTPSKPVPISSMRPGTIYSPAGNGFGFPMPGGEGGPYGRLDGRPGLLGPAPSPALPPAAAAAAGPAVAGIAPAIIGAIAALWPSTLAPGTLYGPGTLYPSYEDFIRAKTMCLRDPPGDPQPKSNRGIFAGGGTRM